MKQIEIEHIAKLLRNGKSVKQKEDMGGLPISRIETIADGSINPQKVGFAGLSEPDNAEWLLKSGDILISHINSIKHLGKCAIYEGNPGKLIHGMNLLNLRCDTDKADSRYIFHVLNSPCFKKQIPNITNNSVNQSSFTVTKFKKIKIPLPSLPEQRRIAAILDKADNLRLKRTETLKLLDQFLRSVFLDMFGDPVRNSKKLPTRALGEIANVCRGRFSPRPRNDPKFYGGDYPFIQTGDIANSNGIIKSWHQTLNDEGRKVSKGFEIGTVVIAIVGATIGETAILGFRSYFPDSVIGITPNHKNATPEYIEYLLRFWKSIFRNRAPETARANINLDTVRPIPIPLASIDLQKKFSSIYKKINVMISRKNEDDENLFRSLTQRAFRGEL